MMSGNIRIVILIRPEDSFCIYIHMVINQKYKFNTYLLIITPSIHSLLSTETLIDLTSHVLYTPLAIFATIGRSH